MLRYLCVNAVSGVTADLYQLFELKDVRLKHLWRLSLVIVITALGVVLLDLNGRASSNPEDEWWPIQVKSYYGEYVIDSKQPGQAAKSLSRPRLEEWVPPPQAPKDYVLGVSFPHLKDPYWVSVNYGIIREAQRMGVGLKLLQAGGYDELENQIDQVRQLADSGVDGIILGAVSYLGLDALVNEMKARNIPVVEVINDIQAPDIAAKAMVSFYEMGFYAGEYFSEHADRAGMDTVTVAFFPGPFCSGWAPDSLQGFQEALQYHPGTVDIVDVRWGDTGLDVQRRLVEEVLTDHGPVDYIIGNAVAAEAAAHYLRETAQDGRTHVISTYLIPPLYDMIKSGRVAGAPSDLTVFQGRMAVDMMIRILEGEEAGKDFPFRSGPFIPMVTPDNIDSYPYEGLFGPRGFKPFFSLPKG